MKSITLFYDTNGFRSADAPDVVFSAEEFRHECERQQISGRQDIVLRVILQVKRFIVIPTAADDEKFFQYHFPSHGLLSSCQLGDDAQKIVYEIPERLCQELSAILPKCHLFADSVLLARFVIHRSIFHTSFDRSGEDIFLVSQSSPNILSVFIAARGKLLFANCFCTGSIEEVRYFVTAVRDKFANSSRCILCSNWGCVSSTKEVIGKLFGSVEELTLGASHSEPFIGLMSDIII